MVFFSSTATTHARTTAAGKERPWPTRGSACARSETLFVWRELFDRIERDALQALPAERFELMQTLDLKVQFLCRPTEYAA